MTPPSLDTEDLERIERVALNSLQSSTQATYGTGLLAFHMFCNQKGVTKDLRAPVNVLILTSFIATLAGTDSAAAISNYVAAVRAWHIVHSTKWDIGGPEVDAIIKGAKAMAPRSSTRELREPMTRPYIEKLHSKLSDTDPLDTAVFACLTSAFWSTARLGELTVKNLTAFDPKKYVKRSDLGTSIYRKGRKSTTIYVPETKSRRLEGESLYWSKQSGESDPEGTLLRHLEINKLTDNHHLFEYTNKEGKAVPLTKKAFQKRIRETATGAGLQGLKGHSIRIRSTLEYLLSGCTFEAMKVKGRWSSDAFHRYIRDHAKVLAPYMQAAPPEIHGQFATHK